MTTDRYDRFQVVRPDYLPDEHWSSIDAELIRLFRSLKDDDDGQTIGDLKCVVESVARVTLDIAGTQVTQMTHLTLSSAEHTRFWQNSLVGNWHMNLLMARLQHKQAR